MSVSEIHAAARQPVKACSKASSGCLRTLRSVNRRFPFQLGNLGYAPSGFIIASSARHIPFPIIPTSSDSSYGPHDARTLARRTLVHTFSAAVSLPVSYLCLLTLCFCPFVSMCVTPFTLEIHLYSHFLLVQNSMRIRCARSTRR